MYADIEVDVGYVRLQDGSLMEDYNAIRRGGRNFIECPDCWRIWIQTERGEYRSYKPEQEPVKISEQLGGYRG